MIRIAVVSFDGKDANRDTIKTVLGATGQALSPAILVEGNGPKLLAAPTIETPRDGDIR